MDESHDHPLVDQINSEKVVIAEHIDQIVIHPGAEPRPVPRTAPPVTSRLIGREDLVRTVISELRSRENSAGQSSPMALVGMGGIGKTSLAKTIANSPEVESLFPDGTLWADFGPEPDVMEWLAAWGGQLGDNLTSHTTVKPRSRALGSLLHGKKVLIVIDDVWKADDARTLMVGGPGCRALITTRSFQVAQELGVERSYRLSTLNDSASLELLANLAPEAVAADKAGAGGLAAQLEGLPLALKLAGRMLAFEWEAGVSTAGALAELQERKVLLGLVDANRKPGLGPKEASLQAILAMSYDRLPDDQTRRAFRSLGAFGGRSLTFSIEAAAAVWAVELRPAQKTIATLYAHALIEQVGRGRYAIHPVLDSMAENLLSSDEAQETLRRHARYFLEVARRYRVDNMDDWQTVDVDWENVRAAMNWASQQADLGEAALTAEFALALRRVVQIRRPAEGELWLQAGAQACRQLNRKADEGWIRIVLGLIAVERGAFTEASEHYSQGLRLFEEAGEQRGIRAMRSGLAHIHFAQGDYEQAIALEEQTTRMCEEAGDIYGTIVGHNNLGDAYRAIKDLPNAIAHLEKSARLCRQSGEHDEVLAIVLGNLAENYLDLARVDRALAFGKESLEIAQRLKAEGQMGVANRVLAEIWSARNDPEKAVQHFDAAIHALVRANDQEELAAAHFSFGRFLALLNRAAEAKQHLEEAYRIYLMLNVVDRITLVQHALHALPQA
jgi:tetratricopeptide (TPR) repeat protein